MYAELVEKLNAKWQDCVVAVNRP